MRGPSCLTLTWLCNTAPCNCWVAPGRKGSLAPGDERRQLLLSLTPKMGCVQERARVWGQEVWFKSQPVVLLPWQVPVKMEWQLPLCVLPLSRRGTFFFFFFF